jgi:hypothetical protein
LFLRVEDKNGIENFPQKIFMNKITELKTFPPKNIVNILNTHTHTYIYIYSTADQCIYKIITFALFQIK